MLGDDFPSISSSLFPFLEVFVSCLAAGVCADEEVDTKLFLPHPHMDVFRRRDHRLAHSAFYSELPVHKSRFEKSGRVVEV